MYLTRGVGFPKIKISARQALTDSSVTGKPGGLSLRALSFKDSSHALEEMANDDLTTVDCVNVLRGGIVEPAPEIRFLRKYLGWSTADFASRMGTARETVSRWESGAVPMGSQADRLLRLLVATAAPVKGLFAAGVDAHQGAPEANAGAPQSHAMAGRVACEGGLRRSSRAGGSVTRGRTRLEPSVQ